MPTAVIAAGVTAAGAIGGGLIASHAQSSAADKATGAITDANNQATQAQLQLGQQSLNQQAGMFNALTGLNTSIYNQNFKVLAPYAANGLPASNQINALLNLPAAPNLKSTVKPPAPIPTQTLPGQNALAPIAQTGGRLM